MFIKRNFKWAQFEQANFNKVKRIVARNTLLTYLDENETFTFHINASKFQLVGVFIQKGKPIALYSKIITDAQQWHIVTER